MSALIEAAQQAPHQPGVYAFLGAQRELLYVGKAADLHRRLGDHARDSPESRDVRRQVLLDAVRTIGWETHADEESAWRREADLIVMLKPAFNASHADQARDLYAVVTFGPQLTSFGLTSTAHDPRRHYGTFPHLAKGAFSHVAKRTKLGYTALLRLLWAAAAPEPTAFIPKRVAGSSPPPHFDVRVSPALQPLLHDLLSGRGARLLPVLRDAVAASDLAEFTKAGLERDVEAAREFFELGPRRVRRFRLRHELAPGPVTGAVMAELLAQELRETVGDFQLRAPGPVMG